MKWMCLGVATICMAMIGFAESKVQKVAATNVLASVASTKSSATKSASEGTEDKLPRRQCEATTKSGTRCKRNAAPNAKFCRQHLKILKTD